MKFIAENKKILIWLSIATLLLSLLPVVDTMVTIGKDWKGVPMLYADEVLYYAQVREVADGHPFFGNPYFYEHRNSLTPAFFGSNWLASIPFFAGLSLPSAIVVNFLFWSLVFVFAVFYLLRRLGAGGMWSAACALFVFIQSYLTAYRMSVRQEVFPFFFIFYVTLFAWLEKPGDKKRIAALAVSAGTSFYLYSFFWQVVVATLGLVFIYAILQRFIDSRFSIPRPNISSVCLVGIVSAVIASPVIYYTWLQVHADFYWEAMSRFGLVNTHLPTAEVVYSGSWVIILLLLFILGWRWLSVSLEKYSFIFVFFALTGLSMVCLQASNVITGKELETAQHVKSFIVPWLSIGFFTWLAYSWQSIEKKGIREIILGAIALALVVANIHFILFITPFPSGETKDLRRDMQAYGPPLAWLEEREPSPTVIWADPANNVTPYIPALTKHYVLYAEPGNLNILPDGEVEDRYLTTRYFHGVSTTTLKNEFALYAGRSRTYHYPKTLERKQKVCRILRITESEWCPKETDKFVLVGDEYFTRLTGKYNDIRPRIHEKLAEYHVEYILRDKKQSPTINIGSLQGSVKEYDDGRFEIYRYDAKK